MLHSYLAYKIDVSVAKQDQFTFYCFYMLKILPFVIQDSRCEDEEIPEAEVRAWRARLGVVKQKRAELRQTLRQRFQQFCHRGCAVDSGTSITGQSHHCHHYINSPHSALPVQPLTTTKPR